MVNQTTDGSIPYKSVKMGKKKEMRAEPSVCEESLDYRSLDKDMS